MITEIEDVKSFINIVDAVTALATLEFSMFFYKDYMSISELTPDSIGMVSLKLGKEFFDGYQTDGADDTYEIVAVDGADFLKMLNKFKAFKRLKIETTESAVKVYASEGKKRKRATLAQIGDPELNDEKVNLTWPTIIKLNADEFRGAIKDTNGTDQVAVFRNSPTELTIYSEDDGKISSNEETWLVGDDMLVLMSEPGQGIWNAETLNDIVSKVGKLSKDVMIHLPGEFGPIKLVYDFPNGILEYILAPMTDPRYDA